MLQGTKNPRQLWSEEGGVFPTSGWQLSGGVGGSQTTVKDTEEKQGQFLSEDNKGKEDLIKEISRTIL